MPDPAADQPDPVRACVEAVDGFLGALTRDLARGADVVRDALAALGRTPASSDLVAAAGPLAAGILADERVLGAGFVAAPGLLSDSELLLAWWQGEDRDRIPASSALRRPADYASKEWFLSPVRTGEVHVSGPYIDYVCSDEFVVTTTVPAFTEGSEPLGVMGADVLVETVERVLVDVFAAAGATLLDARDRVLVAGDARTFAGETVVRRPGDAAVGCRGLPLVVVTHGG